MTQTIAEINAILKGGGIAVLPTETVYGIAARADARAAIDRIYAAKGRGFEKPLAVCVGTISQAETLAVFSPLAKALAAKFWPGPLTLVLPARHKRLDARCYQGKTIALRCPDSGWRESLAKTPLALSSANCSGHAPAFTANTGLDVDGVLDGGPSTGGIPSTILSVRGKAIELLRAGAIKAERFAEFNIGWQE
jgi:L-threonylcarbamoyladenylate synthase